MPRETVKASIPSIQGPTRDWPETSLYYYRARYYDPGTGRFLREDPTRFTGGVNFYAYAFNRPVSLVDPYGLWPSMGDIWNGAKRAKGVWDKGKKYAGKIGCWATYCYCVMPPFACRVIRMKARRETSR